MSEEEVRQALSAVYSNHQWLRSLALKLVRDENSADDLVQQVLLRSMESPPKHARGINGWLGLVMRRLAVDQVRGERSIDPVFELEKVATRSDATPSRDAETLDSSLLLLSAVKKLNEDDLELIMDRYLRNMTLARMASNRRITPKVLTRRLEMALKRLRYHMSARNGENWSLLLIPLLTVKEGSLRVGFSGISLFSITALIACGLASVTYLINENSARLLDDQATSVTRPGVKPDAIAGAGSLTLDEFDPAPGEGRESLDAPLGTGSVPITSTPPAPAEATEPEEILLGGNITFIPPGTEGWTVDAWPIPTAKAIHGTFDSDTGAFEISLEVGREYCMHVTSLDKQIEATWNVIPVPGLHPEIIEVEACTVIAHGGDEMMIAWTDGLRSIYVQSLVPIEAGEPTLFEFVPAGDLRIIRDDGVSTTIEGWEEVLSFSVAPGETRTVDVR